MPNSSEIEIKASVFLRLSVTECGFIKLSFLLVFILGILLLLALVRIKDWTHCHFIELMVATLVNHVLIVVRNFKLTIFLPKIIWLYLSKPLKSERIINFYHILFIRYEKVSHFRKFDSRTVVVGFYSHNLFQLIGDYAVNLNLHSKVDNDKKSAWVHDSFQWLGFEAGVDDQASLFFRLVPNLQASVVRDSHEIVHDFRSRYGEDRWSVTLPYHVNRIDFAVFEVFGPVVDEILPEQVCKQNQISIGWGGDIFYGFIEVTFFRYYSLAIWKWAHVGFKFEGKIVLNPVDENATAIKSSTELHALLLLSACLFLLKFGVRLIFFEVWALSCVLDPWFGSCSDARLGFVALFTLFLVLIFLRNRVHSKLSFIDLVQWFL